MTDVNNALFICPLIINPKQCPLQSGFSSTVPSGSHQGCSSHPPERRLTCSHWERYLFFSAYPKSLHQEDNRIKRSRLRPFIHSFIHYSIHQTPIFMALFGIRDEVMNEIKKPQINSLTKPTFLIKGCINK